jgi:hypothetical protein
MICSLKVLRHRMEGEQFRNQEVISFDQPMEFANCPLSKTASRLLTVVDTGASRELLSMTK